jgi:hypothetical protein
VTTDDAWAAGVAGLPVGDVVRGPGPGSFTARLDRWVADARVDAAALERSRERWLREVAEQEATLAGVLADLAERREPVTLRTSAGRRHHGQVHVIGADFVAMQPASGTDVLVALTAVVGVRTAPTTKAALGDRVVGTDLRLADVLGELAADRERVQLVTRVGDDAVAGVLRSVGHDVVVVRVEGDPPSAAYVPIAAIGEVSIG